MQPDPAVISTAPQLIFTPFNNLIALCLHTKKIRRNTKQMWHVPLLHPGSLPSYHLLTCPFFALVAEYGDLRLIRLRHSCLFLKFIAIFGNPIGIATSCQLVRKLTPQVISISC